MTISEQIEKMVETVMNKYGRIDILVNNAGITRDDLFMRMSEEHWQAVIDTNLTSAFKVTQPVLKIMSKQRREPHYKYCQYNRCTWQPWSSKLCGRQSWAYRFYKNCCLRICNAQYYKQCCSTRFY